jgi:hypothetical protein
VLQLTPECSKTYLLSVITLMLWAKKNTGLPSTTEPDLKKDSREQRLLILATPSPGRLAT